MPRLILLPQMTECCFEEMLSIGRSWRCSYVLEDKSVSRHHCKIHIDDQQWFITDSSSNGVLVNERKCLQETMPLNDNDVVKIGTFEFRFKKKLRDEIEFISDDDSTVIDVDQPPMDLDDELTCSVCLELFVKPMTLNCSHTFCTWCIETWKMSKKNCPTCRQLITCCTYCSAIDNIVQKVVLGKTAEDQLARTELIKSREALQQSEGEGAWNTVGGSPIVLRPQFQDLVLDDDDFEEWWRNNLNRIQYAHLTHLELQLDLFQGHPPTLPIRAIRQVRHMSRMEWTRNVARRSLTPFAESFPPVETMPQSPRRPTRVNFMQIM